MPASILLLSGRKAKGGKMKEHSLHVVAFLILASCFAAGVCIIFDVLHAMDCEPNSKVMSVMGRKGGQVRGLSKARTSEQARAAVMVRWNKVKKDKEQPPAD